MDKVLPWTGDRNEKWTHRHRRRGKMVIFGSLNNLFMFWGAAVTVMNRNGMHSSDRKQHTDTQAQTRKHTLIVSRPKLELMNTVWKLSRNYTFTNWYGPSFHEIWIFKCDAFTIFEKFSKVIAKVIAEISEASGTPLWYPSVLSYLLFVIIVSARRSNYRTLNSNNSGLRVTDMSRMNLDWSLVSLFSETVNIITATVTDFREIWQQSDLQRFINKPH